VDVLNINVPAGARGLVPWRLTQLSRRRYFEPLAPDRSNGSGRPGYRLLQHPEETEPDSDIHALLVDRIVTVTPLSLDMTSRSTLPPADAKSEGLEQVLMCLPGERQHETATAIQA
jgi:5'-nucleotidase